VASTRDVQVFHPSSSYLWTEGISIASDHSSLRNEIRIARKLGCDVRALRSRPESRLLERRSQDFVDAVRRATFGAIVFDMTARSAMNRSLHRDPQGYHVT